MPQKNIGSPTPECLVVVVLDGTYRLEEHFETLNKAYLEQILKHLKAPYNEREDKEIKKFLPILRCGLVVFGNYEPYSPFSVQSHYFGGLTQFEELLTETEFADGGTYENAVSEGLVAALEMFDLHSSQIDPGASQPKKHCILVTNSHPCPDPVHRNMNGKYDEYTFEQITEEMQKQCIHLSLITPEKGFDELENLVKLVNRDAEVHEASDVVKPSHVVKLANFKVPFSQPAEVVTDKKRKREDSTSINDVQNKDQPAPASSASSSPESKKVKLNNNNNNNNNNNAPHDQLSIVKNEIYDISKNIIEKEMVIEEQSKEQVQNQQPDQQSQPLESLKEPPVQSVQSVQPVQPVQSVQSVQSNSSPQMPQVSQVNSPQITRLSTVASPVNNTSPQGVSPSAMANHILPQTKIPQQPPHSMPQLPIQQPVPATIATSANHPVRPMTTPAMIKGLSQLTQLNQLTQRNMLAGSGQIFRSQANQPAANAQHILRKQYLQQELTSQNLMAMRRQQQHLSQLGIRQPIGNFVTSSPPIGSDAQTIFNSPSNASTVGAFATTSPITGFTPTTLGLPVSTTGVTPADHSAIGIRNHMHQKTINALWSGHIAWSANAQGQKRELSCHVTAFPVPQKKTVPLSLGDYMTTLWPERMEISTTNLVKDLFKDVSRNQNTLVVSFLPTPTTVSQENQGTFLILLRLLETKKVAAFIRFPSAPNPNGGLVLFSNGHKIIGVLFMNSPLPTNAPQLQSQVQPQQNQQTQLTPQTQQQHAQQTQAQVQAQTQQIAHMQQIMQQQMLMRHQQAQQQAQQQPLQAQQQQILQQQQTWHALQQQLQGLPQNLQGLQGLPQQLHQRQINPQMQAMLQPQSAAAQQLLRRRNLQLQSLLQTASNVNPGMGSQDIVNMVRQQQRQAAQQQQQQQPTQ
ncbi:hypothetical protein Glove_65g77 [Diversispora epigaea]|uniref:Mediator of RNA polymerase II transcription subunit 25 n=1 Tax=Diversispora epigaea TaxID=1348612 RepID=A0A397JLV2_9GLOM|nr:hypothetical protein Glove_65g77 [Diversispora epigaea]